MKVTLSNGVTYHVEITGKGSSLILLHGFTGDTRTWHPFISQWQDQNQLIMIDILGHGKTDSPKDPERYRIEKVAQDIREILNELYIEQTHILGYSMGGRLALTFTILYPDKVRSLFLESSSPGLEEVEEREKRVNQDEVLAQMILEKGLETFVDYWENIPLFATQSTLDDSIRERIRNQRLEQNPVGLANSLRGMGTGRQPSWWKKLRAVTVPTFLLCGEQDKKFCRINKRMKQLLPNGKFITFSQVGHAIHVEDPVNFGKMVRKLISDVEGKE